ncbi:MAG: DUF4835 family protein [Deinococcales bacterium]|nr:DUF4835 family protein [Chitinophagaceae bacterium]
MFKKITVIIITIFLTISAFSQEFQAKVTVNATRINSTIDRKVFATLQNQLNNFINNRKWTTDQFKPNEKIECSFLINLESVAETNVYKGSLIIQAARPVFNSSYQAALLNFQDADLTFKYVEFQPIEFNDSRVQGNDPLIGNLTATLAFYCYTILGLNYDSFSPKSGDKFYQKAQNIVNNAPEASGINGWKLFDGLRNRYWLNENMVNNRYNIIHDVIYSYYRSGLDKMYDNETEARTNILQSFYQLQAFNQENSNTMFVQVFMQNKITELIGIFKKANASDKAKAIEVFSKLDVANNQRYKDELR